MYASIGSCVHANSEVRTSVKRAVFRRKRDLLPPAGSRRKRYRELAKETHTLQKRPMYIVKETYYGSKRDLGIPEVQGPSVND